MKAASNFSKYVKQKREDAGLSQKQVAEQLGYSTPQFISNWERGISMPPIKSVKKLADIYQTSVEEIFNLLLEDTLLQVTNDFKKKLKKIL